MKEHAKVQNHGEDSHLGADHLRGVQEDVPLRAFARGSSGPSHFRNLPHLSAARAAALSATNCAIRRRFLPGRKAVAPTGVFDCGFKPAAVITPLFFPRR
jgi:hypothetical protein